MIKLPFLNYLADLWHTHTRIKQDLLLSIIQRSPEFTSSKRPMLYGPLWIHRLAINSLCNIIPIFVELIHLAVDILPISYAFEWVIIKL